MYIIIKEVQLDNIIKYIQKIKLLLLQVQVQVLEKKQQENQHGIIQL